MQLTTKTISITLAVLFFGLASCKKDGDDDKGEPDDSRPPNGQGGPGTGCTGVVEDLINVNDGEDTVPTWEQLDCFTAGLVRKPEPDFFANRLSDFSAYVDDRTTPNLGWTMYSDMDAQTTALGTDVAIWTSLNQPPPYFDLTTNSPYTFPLKPEWHEKKIRVAAAMFIAQKLKNRYTSAVFFYPPTPMMDWQTVATSEDEFRAWFTNHFVPEKVVEAQAMERIKVERYTPFVVELETWVGKILPFAASMTVTEKVALAQWMVDTLVPAVRAHFTGILNAHSYINYELEGEAWNQMDYSAFDTLGFSYFPVCGGTVHTTYLETQFENYLKVVEGSGNVKWGVAEIGPSEKTWVDNGCMTRSAYSEKELEIFTAFIEKMKDVSPAPTTVGFSNTFVNPATATLVADYLAAP